MISKKMLSIIAIFAFIVLLFSYFTLTSNKNSNPVAIDSLCSDTPNKSLDQCYKDYILKVADKSGYLKAIEVLEQDKKDPNLAKLCHLAAHSLGKYALENASSVNEAITLGGLSCSNGYYHGILELAGSKLSTTEFVSTINNFCSVLEDEPINHMDCTHGIGHAAYINSNFDLHNSTNLCANLDTSLDRLMCISGVFMQWGIDYRGGLILPRDPKTLRDFCLVESPKYPSEYKAACLQNILLALTINDFQKDYSFEDFRVWCDKLPTKDSPDCYYGIGYAANGLVDFNSTILTNDVCGSSDSPSNQKCIHRMSQGYGAVLGDKKMLADICYQLPPTQQPYCLNVKKYELR